ncbi:hypothetical protein R6Q57_029078 [Mikania cordata]
MHIVHKLRIQLYLVHQTCGDIEKSKDVFNTMRRKDGNGPFPNGITCVVVLVACNHKSLLNKAWCLLGKMSKVYKVQPTIEHYGCVIDLLNRSGQLKETEILTKLMQWHLMVLFETGGNHVLALEPNHTGRWEALIKPRKMMTERKVVVIRGWSFIEVNGIINKFFVDDQFHPQSEAIKCMPATRSIVIPFSTTIGRQKCS